MFKLCLATLIAALSITPVTAQTGVGTAPFKAAILKHLKTSEDFTLKVAAAMPPENYEFKLTPEQMSFGGQMMHLAEALQYFTSAFSGEKPASTKPTAKTKEQVTDYVKQSYDTAIAAVDSLTPEQITKTYKGGESSSPETGYDILLGMLDHTTNHRASAEMYLRAKGITPPKYMY